MFEELNRRRQAVAENISKSFEKQDNICYNINTE